MFVVEKAVAVGIGLPSEFDTVLVHVLSDDFPVSMSLMWFVSFLLKASLFEALSVSGFDDTSESVAVSCLSSSKFFFF